MPKSYEVSSKLLQKFFLAFLDSLVYVLAPQKKLTKNFAGESTDKAIYKMAAKMAAITECEISAYCLSSMP